MRQAEGLLHCRSLRTDPALRLLCLPWAGSGVLGYAWWGLPAELAVETWVVQLPGREDLAWRPPLGGIESMVDALRSELEPLLDLPLAFFGHSMGALLAYELARALRRAGLPGPAHLFVSGFRAPELPAWRPAASVLDDESLLRRVEEIAGPSRSAVRDRSMLLAALPALRADFAACEAYRYTDEPPLDLRMTLLVAVDDVEVRVDEVAAWHRHATASEPVRVFEGGHLYLLDHRAEVLDIVAARLASVPRR